MEWGKIQYDHPKQIDGIQKIRSGQKKFSMKRKKIGWPSNNKWMAYKIKGWREKILV